MEDINRALTELNDISDSTYFIVATNGNRYYLQEYDHMGECLLRNYLNVNRLMLTQTCKIDYY